MSRIGKSVEMESRLVIAGGWGEVHGRMGVTANGYGVSFWVDEMFLN